MFACVFDAEFQLCTCLKGDWAGIIDGDFSTRPTRLFIGALRMNFDPFRISLAVLLAASALCSLAPADPPPSPDEKTSAAEGTPRDPVTDVLVILDSTRSMEQYCKATKRYDLARWAVNDIVSVCPEGIRLGILELKDAVNELRKLEPLNAEDRIRISRDLWTRQAAGSGELRDALQRAGHLLRQQEACVPLVVILTDGEDCKPGEAHGAAAELLQVTTRPVAFRVVGLCQDGQTSKQLQSLGGSARCV